MQPSFVPRMVSDQAKGRNHRYIDRYRPATNRETLLRPHPDESWQRANMSRNSIPLGPRAWLSSHLNSSFGQFRHDNSSPPSVPETMSPPIDHKSEQLTQTPTNKRKSVSMRDAPRSRYSPQIANPNKRKESEAQSRGFYNNTPPPLSNKVRIGGYEVPRHRDDDAAERSPKRRRYTGEKDDPDPMQFRASNADPGIPNGDKSRQLASGNVFDPGRRVSQSQRSGQRGASDTQDLDLQRRRRTPVPSSSPGRRPRTFNSKQLTVVTQNPKKSSSPPANQPNVSPLDPRRSRNETPTNLLSPSNPFRMTALTRRWDLESLSSPVEHQHRPTGLGLTSSQASIQPEYQSPSLGQREAYIPPSSRGENRNATQASGHEHHSPALTENKDQAPSHPSDASLQAPTQTATQPKEAPISTPNKPSADSAAAAFETLKAEHQALQEADRKKQQKHEEEMEQRTQQQKLELELDAKEIMQLERRKAEKREMVRLEEVRMQHEEHERRKREMREWMKSRE